MLIAERPPDEAVRQRTLDTLGILDQSPDPVLDGLVRSAAAITGCPISAISLVDRERQWFLSRTGVDASETPRDVAFCAHAILDDALFEVQDATLDTRFHDNPLVVGGPGVRFYAGAPIKVEGQNVGALCVIDHSPRTMSGDQRRLLRDIANAVEHWMHGLRGTQHLLEARRYNRKLFDHLGEAVFLVDDELRILDANAGASQRLGRPHDELLSLSIGDLLDQRSREWLARQPDTGPDALSKTESRRRIVRRDGSSFAFEAHPHRIDERSSIVWFRDVEASRVRNEQLQQLFLAVEQSSECIVSTDLQGRITYANRATFVQSGYSITELLGQPAHILAASETPESTFDDLSQHLSVAKPWSGTLPSRRKDGTVFTQSATVTPLRNSDGTVTHFVAVMKDVTDELRMQTELRLHREHLEELVAQRTNELVDAMRAAEAANQAKSAFLATMSHEIRTPMNGVVGVLDVLRRSPMTPYQGDLVQTMTESAGALLGIIDDILDFSKIEAGRLSIDSGPVDLPSVIESVCWSLKPIALARDVTLRAFIDPELPDHILSDETRLRQILNNLIGNAIKFSAGAERSGRVDVRAERRDDGSLLLAVSDNGVGIAAEAQARIFKPFEQAEGSTTRRFGGTGLGLSIVSRLCELFGGTIAVQSEPGRGARFEVMLPLETAPQARPYGQSNGMAGIHCKVVSPEADTRADWGVYLTAAGAEVEILPGIDALRQSLEQRPFFICVVVIDARSDGIDLRALDELRASFSILLVLVGDGQHRDPRIVDGGSVFIESRLVFRDSIVKAVEMAVGFDQTAEGMPARTDVAPAATPSIAEAEAAGRLVLVAEDNTINQKVILTQLEVIGFAGIVVGDGGEALEAWRTGRFGLVLTDVHMPVLDGYALAQAIRREEGDGPHVPIVALTANTSPGEAARCRAAGMDAWMSKPAPLDELAGMLDRWLPAAPQTAADDTARHEDGDASPAAVDALPVFDADVLTDLVGRDDAIVDEFLDAFRGVLGSTTDELRNAARDDDRQAASAIAHRLKSSARAVGALLLGERCERLETLANEGSSAIGGAVADFEAAVVATEQALDARRATGAPPAADDGPVVEESLAGVLILEDRIEDAQRLTSALRAFGVDVLHHWQDGRVALDWLRGRDTSSLLVMVDLNMPAMDGIDFMRRLADQGFSGAVAICSSADQRVLETAAKLASAQRLEVLGHFRKPLAGRRLETLLALWRGYVPRDVRKPSRRFTANEVLRGVVNNEMTLHYQPKVSVHDGAVVGLEALVRWNHPDEGLVGPGAFVEVVEAQGGIDMLTGAVLSLALQQARRWNAAGTPQSIAINVSMSNLLRLDFPELLSAEAARHKVPITDVRLEVTESRLMSDQRAQVGALARLKLKGIGLSIDDFGTGHSSLSQLRDIPFDELKIDRSFVHGAGQDATQRALFAASLGMAHELKMRVVAEGVEDRADWDFVRGQGVDFAQGYFIAMPMAATALPGWLEQWNHRLPELL